jgi:cephalosporin-C deacetylase
MPLTFDFPLDQLRTYRGTNPCPHDFDKFWDDSLLELKKVDPKTKLIPAEFMAPGVECFHLYFMGIGGARVHAKLLRPKKTQTSHPAVLMFHGYGGDSGDWWEKLSYIAQDFTVAAMDCRGQGGLSEDKGSVIGNTLNGHLIRGLEDALKGSPEKFLYHQLFLDAAELAKIIMGFPDVDPARIGALGDSQGGALTLACAALVPMVKRASLAFPFLSDYKRAWEMDLAKIGYSELTDYFRRFDPTHKEEDTVFEKLGYIDIQFLARRVKAEVLWGIGLMDTDCPPSTQFAVYNKIQSPKKMVIYPDYRHEGLPGFNDQRYQFMMGL